MRTRAVLTLCAVLAVVLPARATVMMRMSVEELARTSDVIVVGRVVRTEARLERRGIVTHVELAVDDWWAGGDTVQPTVELLVHGGRVGDRAQLVDGQAVFTPGEDVVVFLFRGGGALWPQGMSQGKWRLRPDARSGAVIAASEADASSLVERDAAGVLVPVRAGMAEEAMSLVTLRARVLAARGGR